MADRQHPNSARCKRNPVRSLVLAAVWLWFPCTLKNRVLNLFGNRIDRSATLCPCLVWSCGTFDIARGAAIMPGNVFHHMNRVEMGNRSFIGRLNRIHAQPHYQCLDDRAGILMMGEAAGITNRHSLDCSGRVELRHRSAVGGFRSIISSHDLDIRTNRMRVSTVVLGAYSLTGTRCTVLPGSRIPEKSVVGMGSLVTPALDGNTHRSGVFAGSPARWRRELPDCAWWHRDADHTEIVSRQNFDADL